MRDMCLAVPGKVASIKKQDGICTGRIQFGGNFRQACLDFVPEVKEGDYVVVHVGFAISIVDKGEAERTYALLESMGVLAKELTPDGAAPVDS
jgi:hydrogenase expression/formation protein HypC